MILPIAAYGHPVLRENTEEIGPDYPNLPQLIDNMYSTMYNAQGVGLAAPQVGLALRLFIVDATPMKEENPDLDGYKKVFINPRMESETGESWAFEEGCLSIPEIREQIWRHGDIVLSYQDENFVRHTESFSGLKARIIQHEYDHIEGILFIDHISPMRKQLLKARLLKIAKGMVDTKYPMKFGKKRV